MPPTVLIVDDDPAVARSIREALEDEGFGTCVAQDGSAALDAVRSRSIDLVLLDLQLPGLDGFEVCRQIRLRSAVPVVMVTARADAAEVVTGLETGADDYIVKPFEATVLVARARAVLRRYGDDVPRLREVRDLTVDEAGFRVSKATTPLPLTPIETRLLVELVRHADRIMTREALLESVWGYGYLGDSRLVDMAIKRLRDKLGDPPSGHAYIATVRGVGYRFESGGAPTAALDESEEG